MDIPQPLRSRLQALTLIGPGLRIRMATRSPERWQALCIEVADLLEALERVSTNQDLNEIGRAIDRLASRYDFRGELEVEISRAGSSHESGWRPEVFRGGTDSPRGDRSLRDRLFDLRFIFTFSSPPMPSILPPPEPLCHKVFANIRVPDEVPVWTTFEVSVRIRDNRLSDKDEPMEMAPAPSGPTRLDVEIVVPDNGGIVAVGPTQAILSVAESGCSHVVAFELEARQTGPCSLQLLIRQDETTRLDRVYPILVTRVAETAAAPSLPSNGDSGLSGAHSATARITPDAAPIDLSEDTRGNIELELRFKERSADFRHYRVLLRAPGFDPEDRSDRIDLPVRHQSLLELYCRDLLGRDGYPTANSREEHHRMVGARLTGQFLSERQSQFLAAQPEGTSLHILSEDPWIPWELLWLGHLQRGCFLGERFAVTRGLPDFHLPSRLQPEQAVLVAPQLKGLTSSHERGALEHLFGRFRELRRQEEVMSAMREGPRGAFWHITTHGNSPPVEPDGAYLRLEDDARLHLTDVPTVRMLEDPPLRGSLMVVNACLAGTPDENLWGHGSWATTLLKAGAGAVVAPSWPILNRLAAMFAACFYEGLEEGKTVGEAARLARLRIRETGDATWLAYTVYADRAAYLVRS